MRRPAVTSATELASKAELFDALNVMLSEAGSRASPDEAALVISHVLCHLSEQHPQLTAAAQVWTSLQAAERHKERV